MATVTVTFGADSEAFEGLVGLDLSSAITAGRQILSVPADISARLNGSEAVDMSVILKNGDEISFYKASGSKGF